MLNTWSMVNISSILCKVHSKVNTRHPSAMNRAGAVWIMKYSKLNRTHRSSPPAAWRACCAVASGWRPCTSTAPAECFWRGPPPGREGPPVAPEKLEHTRSNRWWGSLRVGDVRHQHEGGTRHTASRCRCVVPSTTTQDLSHIFILEVTSWLTFFKVHIKGMTVQLVTCK